jgi:hypothetical protein
VQHAPSTHVSQSAWKFAVQSVLVPVLVVVVTTLEVVVDLVVLVVLPPPPVLPLSPPQAHGLAATRRVGRMNHEIFFILLHSLASRRARLREDTGLTDRQNPRTYQPWGSEE